MYPFDTPLSEGVILKRKSQFTMDVLLNQQIITCHCPTTGRIGDIDTKNIACLVSKKSDKKRKLPYTVEAISCDDLDSSNKRWVGINQILSNKIIEFFLTTHKLDNMISNYDVIKRETILGSSKLDFLVGDTYIEVKTPLTTLHVSYGKHIITRPFSPFASTNRFTKHIKELADSLENHNRAILLTVYQYKITEKKKNQRSTHYREVHNAMCNAIAKGIEIWEIELEFTPIGVSIINYKNTTNNMYE